MNNWNALDRFYKKNHEVIMSCKAYEWAFAPGELQQMVVMTPIEASVWEMIREMGVVFYPQFPIAGYFLDFANPVRQIIIECDGRQWHKDKEKDAARDNELADRGWTTYRFPGWFCFSDLDDESGNFGEGRKFLEKIADHHSLRRPKTNTGWIRPWDALGATA